ncbi:hypothetical protein P7C70_g5172, partial [Phenoliferia sp. Uapishka_3]
MEAPNSLKHTKALLVYLLAAYPKRPVSNPQRSTAPASLLLSVQNLALESGPSSNGTNGSEANGDGDEETDEEGDRSSVATSSAASSTEAATDEEQLDNVIELLEDDAVDEEDKPEALKDLLSSLLHPQDTEPLDLDPIILALLHRYREDLHPSGTPLPPLPTHGSITPLRPSVSRSSSFRRNFGSNAPLSMSAVRPSARNEFSSSASSASSRSAPTSPFRAASPSIHSARQTPAHSPWSSPRPTPLTLTLNAAAVEFKFSAGASEFRPGGSRSGTSSPVGARSRSPNPTNAHAAQAQWAATASPLGTPKLTSSAAMGGTHSAMSSPGYFPRHLEAGVFQQQMKGKIPRMPWHDATDSGGEGGVNGDEDEEEDDDPEPREYAYLHNQQPEDEWADLQRQQQGFQPFEQDTSSRAKGAGAWDPFDTNDYDAEGEYGEGYTPTLDGGVMGADTAEFANSLNGIGGLGGMGAYSMTPFDVLHSVFAGSDVSAAVLEEALVMSGWDVDQAIEYIIDTQPGGGFGGEGGIRNGGGDGSLVGTPTSQLPPQVRMSIASGSRPLVVSHDSFDNYVGGNGGRGSPSGGPRWQPRPSTPNGDSGRGVGGRVCRYYLSGNCLRSDCKFSHDVGKAVCKFWLRGHCLKGDGRCDFLHSIPPIMRADFEQRARHRSASNMIAPEEDLPQDAGPDLDFPSLGEAPRSRRQGGRVTLDPTRTRFSGAVKFGRTAPPPPPVRSIAQAPIRDALPQPRYSARINLRPPALLPTLPTGAALSALYIRYRSSFLELGANRNKCLARASECWKRGDGAGARKWSRDAQDWNRQVAIEGRDSANRIIEERKKLIKDALNQHDGRSGSTDDAADRRARGHERGGGVCLGVVSQAVLSRAERQLTAEERTEVALDLHGLHADEAVASLGAFLAALEHERFAGLAFIVIGQAKHSGQTDPDRGAAAGKLRLEQACSEFLMENGWPWQNFHGIIVADALRN